MNLCTFVGRITRDPEIRYTQDSQMPIAKFTLAVDRNYKAEEGEESADFFPCVAFDKRAEFAEKYLYQGIRIAINGKMRNNNYTNRNGEKVYGNSLYVDNIEFADGKREAGQELPAQAAAAGSAQAAGRRTAQGAAQTSGSSRSQSAGRAAAGTGQTARAGAGQPAGQAGRTGAAQAAKTGAVQGAGQTGARSAAAGQRTAANRTAARGAISGTGAAGRAGAARGTAARAASAYGDGFMNIPDGIEDEGLPFH